MGKLYDIIQAHMDSQPYPVSARQVAEKIGVSPTTLGNWREPRKLVAREHLEAIARLTRTPYGVVLDALLEDIGYQSPGDDGRVGREIAAASEAVRAAKAAGATPDELLAIIESDVG